jgi:hypothetical protein
MAVMVHLKPEIYDRAQKLREIHEEKLKAYLEARRTGEGRIGEDEIKRLFEEERLARKSWEDYYMTHFGWKSTSEG